MSSLDIEFRLDSSPASYPCYSFLFINIKVRVANATDSLTPLPAAGPGWEDDHHSRCTNDSSGGGMEEAWQWLAAASRTVEPLLECQHPRAGLNAQAGICVIWMVLLRYGRFAARCWPPCGPRTKHRTNKKLDACYPTPTRQE